LIFECREGPQARGGKNHALSGENPDAKDGHKEGGSLAEKFELNLLPDGGDWRVCFFREIKRGGGERHAQGKHVWDLAEESQGCFVSSLLENQQWGKGGDRSRGEEGNFY